jgi:hypothetical protein
MVFAGVPAKWQLAQEGNMPVAARSSRADEG